MLVRDYRGFGTMLVPGQNPGPPTVGELRGAWEWRNNPSYTGGGANEFDVWNGTSWAPAAKSAGLLTELAKNLATTAVPISVVPPPVVSQPPRASNAMGANQRLLLMLGFGLAAGLFIFRR